MRAETRDVAFLFRVRMKVKGFAIEIRNRKPTNTKSMGFV